MEIREALKTRRSVRSYESRPVPREILEDILECTRWSPSACNEQPWAFVVVTDPVMRARIAEFTDFGKFIADAPSCIAVLCEDGRYYLEDGCIATYSILLTAWGHGLGTCWVAGDKKPYAAEIVRMLGAPANHRLVALVALGYPAAQPRCPRSPSKAWFIGRSSEGFSGGSARGPRRGYNRRSFVATARPLRSFAHGPPHPRG